MQERKTITYNRKKNMSGFNTEVNPKIKLARFKSLILDLLTNKQKQEQGTGIPSATRSLIPLKDCPQNITIRRISQNN